MLYNIEQVLGNHHQMFFHPGLPLSSFTPGLTLVESVERLNQLLDQYNKDFSQYNKWEIDKLGQIMRANWIYQRLDIEPIRKPILVHEKHNQLVVDCGDTRIMAVSQARNCPNLSVIVTVDNNQANKYINWVPIKNNQDLLEVTGFDVTQTNIYLRLSEPDQDWYISWLEIDSASTSHHLHDSNLRINMMKNWIDTMPDDFRFSVDWITWPINWAEYQES